MNVNLVLATGFAYAVLGALIMFLSHRALYTKASRIVAGYPKVLSALRAHRHDGRFGLIVLLCGNALQALAACGYSVSLAHWRWPACAALVVLAGYMLWRVCAVRSTTRSAPKAEAGRGVVRQTYETRRSRVLLEAARREADNRRMREAAKGPRNRSVVYLGHELECRWWSDHFGVSTETLKAAVRQVGPMVTDVERHLARRNARGGYAFAA